jgi:hypothetical protein
MLEEGGIGYDWMVNASGQDYPLLPLKEAERELASSRADGYCEHFPVLSPMSTWPAHRARTRYWYHYRQLLPLSERAIRRLRPLHALNWVQPAFRIYTSTGLSVGLRARTPFGKDFNCYGGSFFVSLKRQCIEYLMEFTRERPDVERHYQKTISPDESYMQTVLVNSRRFNLVNDCKRYFDFSASQFNHPRLLDASDVAPARASGAHFSRKWDLERDPDAFDEMDRHVYGTVSSAKGSAED